MRNKKVRSKHNNLLNYFLYDDRQLSPVYVKKCKKFLERIIMDNEINDRSVNPLIRIADALEEILRLVKKDLDAAAAYRKQDE